MSGSAARGPAGSAAPLRPRSRAAVPPGRILVVDDNELNREMLARRLARDGHAVAIEPGGAEALARLAREEFDVVLLDVMMPEPDGRAVLERIKAEERHADLPVVMISANEANDVVSACLEAGAEDYLPKPFSPAVLRARVRASLEAKRRRDLERRAAEAMEKELEIGRRIQRGFLPDRLPELPGWELAALFRPARQCAGDFYDLFLLPDGRLALVVADVCDKGIGASIFMALYRSLLRATLLWGDGGAAPDGQARLVDAARRTSDYVAGTHSRANIFTTAFVALLDPASGALDYVNAGHEPPAILDGSGVRVRLEPTAPALGLLEGTTFAAAGARLAPGELLFVYTDGAPEAKGVDGAFLGVEALLARAAADRASAAATIAGVEAAVLRHVAGAAPHDDLTAIALRRL